MQWSNVRIELLQGNNVVESFDLPNFELDGFDEVNFQRSVSYASDPLVLAGFPLMPCETMLDANGLRFSASIDAPGLGVNRITNGVFLPVAGSSTALQLSFFSGATARLFGTGSMCSPTGGTQFAVSGIDFSGGQLVFASPSATLPGPATGIEFDNIQLASPSATPIAGEGQIDTTVATVSVPSGPIALNSASRLEFPEASFPIANRGVTVQVEDLILGSNGSLFAKSVLPFPSQSSGGGIIFEPSEMTAPLIGDPAVPALVLTSNAFRIAPTNGINIPGSPSANLGEVRIQSNDISIPNGTAIEIDDIRFNGNGYTIASQTITANWATLPVFAEGLTQRVVDDLQFSPTGSSFRNLQWTQGGTRPGSGTVFFADNGQTVDGSWVLSDTYFTGPELLQDPKWDLPVRGMEPGGGFIKGGVITPLDFDVTVPIRLEVAGFPLDIAERRAQYVTNHRSWGPAIRTSMRAENPLKIEGALYITNREVGDIELEVTEANQPIGSTGAELVNGSVALRNLNKQEYQVTTLNAEGEVISTEVLETDPWIDIQADLKNVGSQNIWTGSARGSFSRTGVKFEDGQFRKLDVTDLRDGLLAITWGAEPSMEIGGEFTYEVTENKGNMKITLVSNGISFSGQYESSVIVPSQVPFVGGETFGKLKAGIGGTLPESFWISMKKCINLLVVNPCLGVRIAWPPSISFEVSAKEAMEGLRSWETPFVQHYVMMEDGLVSYVDVDKSLLSGDEMVMSFNTNVREQSKVYVEGIKSKDSGYSTSFDLEPGVVSVIRLTYQNDSGDPDMVVFAPDNTEFSQDNSPFVGTPSFPGRLRVNTIAREAAFFIYSENGGQYDVLLLSPETLGEFAISLHTIGEEPSVDIE